MTLKLGLIGCSNVAEKNLFNYLSDTSNYQLWSVGSRSKEKASRWANEYGAKYAGSYQDVLETDIDVVYISLPISMHEEWTIKAALHGKNIICEKSSTISLKSAKKMIYSCRENNVRLLEAFSFRFHPQHLAFKDIATKKSNSILNFYGSYGMPSFPKNDIRWDMDLGGGVLNDVVCYPVCASRLFFNSNPVSVYCKKIIDKDSGVDTKVDIMAEFPDKKIAYLSGGFDHYYQSKYLVWSDKLQLELLRAYAVPPNRKTKIILHIDDMIQEQTFDEMNQFGLMFDNFHDVTKLGKNELFNFEEDLLEQALYMEALRQSASSNKPIELSSLID